MSNILNELKIQEEIEGPSDSIEMVKKLYHSGITSGNLFRELTRVKFHRYGKNSYECHRFRYPNESLLLILKAFK